MEVLVVVLIIGILTSVALPQYQKAVAKARLANVKNYVSALKQAEEVYYSTHNTYTTDLSLLDVDLNCQLVADTSVLSCDDYLFIDVIGGALQLGTSYINAYYCPHQNKSWNSCITENEFIYTVWLDESSSPGAISCGGRTDFGKAICKNP